MRVACVFYEWGYTVSINPRGALLMGGLPRYFFLAAALQLSKYRNGDPLQTAAHPVKLPLYPLCRE